VGTRDGHTAAFRTAATAARERAEQCRRRRAELLTGACLSGPDRVALANERLARANEHLERAIERAHAAEGLRADVVGTHQFNQVLLRAGVSPVGGRPHLPPRLDHASVATPLAAGLLQSISSGSATVLELWITFSGYGGEASYIEFEGYVNGAWSMSAPDRQLLSHVYREHREAGWAEP
jgi:hypothetical protein